MADDLTNVPDIVRRQAEEAMKQFNAAHGSPEKQEKPEEPAATEASSEPPAEKAEEASEKAPEKAPEAPPAPEKKPVPTTFKEVATEEMTKEQRYKIMEGMQKAAGRDLSRAQAETRALREELKALNEKVSAMSAVQPTSAPTPSAAPSSDLREQVAEAFGSENVERFFQLMRQEGFVAKPDLDAVRGEVGSVARNVAQTAYDRFQNTLDDLAPGWQKINEDPKFIEYMNEEEGRTGMTRLDFAKRHMDRLDALRLSQYFVDFNEVNPPVLTTPQKLDKKKFASPPSTPATGKEPEEKGDSQFIKASEMARFAREVIISKYKGNTDGMSKKDTETWNMYLTAQREGRLLEDK